MKKVLLFFSIILSSCYSYIDNGKNIYSEHSDFIIKNGYNEYIYKSKIYGKSDDEIFRPRHYKIKLPKGIISLIQINNILYVEYEGKQIICVESNYFNNKTKKEKWKLINPDNEMTERLLLQYWEDRNYNVDKIYTKKQRVTKLYSNGIFAVLLYNIKKKNFDTYLNLVKSIKEYDE